MKTYDELKALIEQRGVHPEFGEPGENFGIEQNPHELATFLVRMQELGVTSCLEIGTGYKGGLSRFLAQDMGWDVTTVDIKNYGHAFEGVHYVIGDKPLFTRQFDLVFIDGDHKYESVGSDLLFYRVYADKVIAFHDVLGLRDCEGVERFWKELAYDLTEYALMVEGKEKPIVMLKPGFNEVSYWGFKGSVTASGIGWIEL